MTAPDGLEERPADYSDITEAPGAGATREQLARLLNRYQTARRHAAEKRVLEVACGAGLGLGYLNHVAKQVVGGDYTASLLRVALATHRGRPPVVQLDAHALPFSQASFDLVLIFEALYYLQDAPRALREARRVLAPGGTLLLCTVNKDWSGFSPSRFSTRYFSVDELRDLFASTGFTGARFFGAFPAAPETSFGAGVAAVRRLAAALHLVPKTLAGRAALKRLFYGSLSPLPAEVDDGLAAAEDLVELPSRAGAPQFKIIYAKAEVA